jgi:hypothetical protein
LEGFFESLGLGLVGGHVVVGGVGVGVVLVGLRDGVAGCGFEGLVLGAWEGEAED